VAGQSLLIPSQALNANSSETLKPYEPGKATGSLDPTLPMPANKDKCGGMGKIIMAVVAVAVAAWAPQFLSTLTQSLLSATSPAGLAIGGAAGSIASQAVGVAIGAQDIFSWKGVALSALAGGVSGGLPTEMFNTGYQALSTALRMATANALTQGIGVATGLQKKFDWKGVAASAAGGFAGAEVGARLPEGLDPFLGRVVTGFAAGTAAAVARGGRVAIQQVAVDAFGNALGSSLAEAIGPRYTAQESFRRSEINQQNAQAAAVQGVGPWSAANYRNGSDVESDRVTDLNGFMNAFSNQGGSNGYPGVQLAFNGNGRELGGVNFSGDRLPSMFPEPQVIRSGVNGGLNYFDYDTGTEASGVRPQSDLVGEPLDSMNFVGPGLRTRTSTSLGDIGLGVLELGYASARNGLTRIAGGVTSWGVLAMDGVDAAVQYQQAFRDRYGYVPSSAGAYAIGSTWAPVANAFNAASTWVRGQSENYLGDGLTSFIGATGQFALEAGATVTGLRTVGSALDNVAVNWGTGVPSGGLYSLQAGGIAVPEIRFVNSIRNDIMSALPEGASLVQTTRGGAAIVRFGDDAFYNIPMQSNAAAYSRVLSDVRAMDTMGGTFTDVAQNVRNGYSFDLLPERWQARIEGTPLRYLADKWESAARGTYVHEGVELRLRSGLIPGGEGYQYMRVGPDLIPSSGMGLKYEITQQTSSLNAIIDHSRRYPHELLRYVTYK
jgi:hypothetical protein